MFLKSEAAREIKCTVYRSAKFLKFFVGFDQILYIFFEKLSAFGGFVPQTSYRGSAPGPCWGTSVPQTPWVCPPPHSYVASAATEDLAVRTKLDYLLTTGKLHWLLPVGTLYSRYIYTALDSWLHQRLCEKLSNVVALVWWRCACVLELKILWLYNGHISHSL